MIKQCRLMIMLFVILGSSMVWAVDTDTSLAFSSTSSDILLAQADFTVEQAIKRVKRQYPGKILKAEQIESKGPKVFKVKVLMKGGRIKNVFVDGASGDVFEP